MQIGNFLQYFDKKCCSLCEAASQSQKIRVDPKHWTLSSWGIAGESLGWK